MTNKIIELKEYFADEVRWTNLDDIYYAAVNLYKAKQSMGIADEAYHIVEPIKKDKTKWQIVSFKIKCANTGNEHTFEKLTINTLRSLSHFLTRLLVDDFVINIQSIFVDFSHDKTRNSIDLYNENLTFDLYIYNQSFKGLSRDTLQVIRLKVEQLIEEYEHDNN